RGLRRGAGWAARNLLRADRAALRGVQQLDQGLQLRVGLLDLVEDREAAAGDHHEAAPDRAVRVVGLEQRCSRVVEPRLVEEEALLAARRVVRELVQDRVEDAEGAPQARCRGGQVLRGGPQV